MSKLCYKSGGTEKKYELKDSASTSPKLAVKIGGNTKYLGLVQGTKSGELELKVGGNTYYVQTKPYEYYGTKRTGTLSGLIEPIRGYASATRGGYSKLAAWPIYDSNRKIFAAIMAGAILCRSGKHSDTETNTTIDLRNVAPDPTSTTVNLTSGFATGYFNDQNKEVLYKVSSYIKDTGSNADKNRDASQVYAAFRTVLPVTTATIKDSLLNKITTYAENNPIGNRADNSITDSTWATKYNGTVIFNKPQSTGCHLRCFSTDPSSATAGLNMRAYGYMNDYNWGSIMCTYVEFPKNGLIGVPPSDLITEWYSKIGKQMVFVSTDSLACEAILPIQPGLGTYADIYAAMQEKGLTSIEICGRECHYIVGNGTGSTAADTLKNCSNSKKVTFSITSFPSKGTGYYKDGTKEEVLYLATDTSGYIYVVCRTNNVRAIYNRTSVWSSSVGNYVYKYTFRYLIVQSYGALKIKKYSYSASAGYTLVATYNA